MILIEVCAQYSRTKLDSRLPTSYYRARNQTMWSKLSSLLLLPQSADRSDQSKPRQFALHFPRSLNDKTRPHFSALFVHNLSSLPRPFTIAAACPKARRGQGRPRARPPLGRDDLERRDRH